MPAKLFHNRDNYLNFISLSIPLILIHTIRLESLAADGVENNCDFFRNVRTEDSEEGSDEYSDVKILPSILYGENPESTEEFEGKFLGLMDVSGRPSKEFGQVGATVGGKKAEILKKLAEEEGLEAAIEKMRDHDSQWERVYSPNGICPTIAKSVPPLILVSNEVDTCNEPMEIEIEIPKRTLNPLW